MILATVLLTLATLAASPPAFGASSADIPELAPAVIPPMAFVAIDADTDLPLREYGLPDRPRERENEEEDGDGDDTEIAGAAFRPPTSIAR